MKKVTGIFYNFRKTIFFAANYYRFGKKKSRLGMIFPTGSFCLLSPVSGFPSLAPKLVERLFQIHNFGLHTHRIFVNVVEQLLYKVRIQIQAFA